MTAAGGRRPDTAGLERLADGHVPGKVANYILGLHDVMAELMVCVSARD